MILHILVGDLILESFPKKCKWLKLQLFADDIKEYGIYSDQFFGENIVRFNQTVHIPTDDFESVITKVSFVINAIKFDGTHVAIGNSSLLCSSIEQATTKSIVLHDKLEAYVGRITVTVFHNPTPVDLGDEILYKHNNYQPNLKEYSFLLTRRKNRPDSAMSQPISFNHNQERSVNETVAEYKSTEDVLRGIQESSRKAKVIESKVEAGQHVFTSKLFGKHNFDTPLVKKVSAPINQIKKSPPVKHTFTVSASKPIASTRKINYPKEPPKVRQTNMKVGYAHTKWPEKEDFEQDKKLFKIHLAEQRRLAMLKEVAAETKYRNEKDSSRSIEARARKLKIAQQDLHLQSVLESKELEIKRLRYQLQTLKASARKPPRPQSAPPTVTKPRRRTPVKIVEEVDSSTDFISAPPRSPASRLNDENMALRLLQRKHAKHRHTHSEELFNNARASGTSYSPYHTFARTSSAKKAHRQSAPASYQMSTENSNNRFKNSNGADETIRSYSNDRKAHTAAAVHHQRRHSAPATQYREELSYPPDRFSLSDNSSDVIDVPANSHAARVVKIPTAPRVVMDRPLSAKKSTHKSDDWLASARASVGQLQNSSYFIHHRQQRHHTPKKSPDSQHKKKHGKPTSPYAIIEQMASKYPNKHFASHPYFSDSDTSEIPPPEDKNDKQQSSLELTTSGIMDQLKDIQAREKVSQYARSTMSAIDRNSLESFGSNSYSTDNQRVGIAGVDRGHVPGFLNAFVHADNFPSMETSVLDTTFDTQASNTSTLNTANIMLNADKKASERAAQVKLLPTRNSNESDTIKYHYKIPGGSHSASSVTSAGSAAEHQAQIAAQFEKNRQFVATTKPAEPINYAEVSQSRSSEAKDRQILSQFEKNRLYNQQQQQLKEQQQQAEKVAPTIQIEEDLIHRNVMLSPTQLNQKMEEVGRAMGSLEKRIDSFIQNSASKQLLRSGGSRDNSPAVENVPQSKKADSESSADDEILIIKKPSVSAAFSTNSSNAVDGVRRSLKLPTAVTESNADDSDGSSSAVEMPHYSQTASESEDEAN